MGFKEELKKFIGKNVAVTYYCVDKPGYMEGTLRAVLQPYLNVILMTKGEKVLIKNIVSISRKRTFTKDGNR